MRVAVFADNDYDTVTGVTTALAAARRWAPADVSLRTYTAGTLAVDEPDYLALAAAGVPLPFRSEMKVYWPSWRELARRIERDGIDVIHLATPGPVGLGALWVARQSGLAMIGSLHTDLEAYAALVSGSPRLGRWMGSYLGWMYEHCQAVLVQSEATRAMLIARGVARSRLTVWPHGVDTDDFRPERRSTQLRSAWRVSDQQPALMYVGRLAREQGLARLAALSDALRRAGLEHRLVFVGDGPLRRELADRCPDAVFLGAVGREAVAAALASGDVFVFPCETEPAAGVLLEAQASGLPVVVSCRGGTCDDLSPNVSGFACEAPSSWHMAVAALLRDANRRREMGVAARGYALGRRWERTLPPLFQAYRRAVSRPGE